jgi:sensor histidine kinase YesM
MKIFFAPRDKLFWQYHCSALFLLVFINGLIFYFWQSEKLLNAIMGAVWVPLFTLGALIFRYFYKVRLWHRISTARTISGVLVYGFVMGALVTLIMMAIVIPFFLGHLVNNPEVIAHKTTVLKMLLQTFIGNTLQNQLIISAWVFIYISIASNRRIRETEVSNLRLQNSLKEAQLANLGNQLNPHFLFNAINNIRFTIYEDATKADAMLTGLSEMLRYSLERSKQDKVRLSEELEIIALYIDLIKVQMEDRLQFSLKVAPSLYNYLIPPMTLQLLVENAVKHGIDKLRHGGRIELTAELAEQQLIFKVNNSRGDNKPLLSSEAASNNIGIGLINIQERLRLLYGDKASLHIEQTSNNFSVTLSVPQESGI